MPAPLDSPSTYRIGRAAFLLLLGICLSAGFLALVHQAPGLIGSRGITPLHDVLDGWRRNCGDRAPLAAPSLFWLCEADWFITFVAGLGLAAAISLTIGLAPRAACVVAYVAWLSFRALEGGTVRWFNYPYDDLQCEVVFLGIAIAPGSLWLWRARSELATWKRWLVIWLLLRLLLGPGLTKVVFHEPWRDLSAIGDFLLTMPHPTAAAAVFASLPTWCLQAMCVFTLVCELLCPFLFLLPGRPRRFAAAACIALMVGIQIVCNIRGFNLLTIGLLLMLWDDAALLRLLPARWRPQLEAPWPAVASAPRRVAAAGFAGLVLFATIGPTATLLSTSVARLAPFLAPAERALQPLRIASCYTMFCLMPDQRLGLVVQGSDDGENWRDYEPLGAPARVDRVPRSFAPYHDYLGFKLWFAGFCPPSEDEWLRALQRRLLEAEPTVLRLFAATPFGDVPPRQVRIEMFRFTFATDTAWHRESLGIRIAAARRQD
ncbi:MAG: lipase maturation factor family protein [Planctomycetes bacterium]|nr:lipase maturation factor family protein [Planctomycetota bacterium]